MPRTSHVEVVLRLVRAWDDAWVRVWLFLMIGCGDNRIPAQPADSPPPVDIAITPDAPSGMPGMPDLRWVANLMDSSIRVMPETFPADSCEMEEQCIGAPGTRQLLRFDAIAENAGTADLIVGPPPSPGISAGNFVWSRCHGHHHFNGYAVYELVDGDDVVITGRKQAFCILDTIQRTPGKASNGYTCINQGLTAGWADVYSSGLACQWLDITDVPAGAYTLRVTVNPDGLLPESDRTNNVYEKSVTF